MLPPLKKGVGFAQRNRGDLPLLTRAKLYSAIRAFFAEKNVLEVETPLLCQHTVTDPHIESFAIPTGNKNYYLQTSPEYAMKRLLAEGSGDIYQITKAFRQGEAGSQHNPEFTMLEFYRVGFDHHALMHELDELLRYCANTAPAEKITYQKLFLSHLQIDPLKASLSELKNCITTHDIAIHTEGLTYDSALQILLTHLIEPKLGIETPLFLYDFPPSQAALSIINNGVAERFELYLNGKEIANGFHELTNANEQLKRFQKNQIDRQENGQCIPEIDYYFIDALKQGLPACAGVAVGLDRLLMHIMETNKIQDVLAFGFERA